MKIWCNARVIWFANAIIFLLEMSFTNQQNMARISFHTKLSKQGVQMSGVGYLFPLEACTGSGEIGIVLACHEVNCDIMCIVLI
jgi:methylase of polypeptide subunit release factors